jgi:peroxisomal 3,2-trans-enoyl-CoA isomerase
LSFIRAADPNSTKGSAARTHLQIYYYTPADIHIHQFNRPKALNSFGGNLIPDIIAGLRVLNEHPDTIFTVLTGEGRFFSAGADVKGIAGGGSEAFKNDAEKKLSYMTRFSYGMSPYLFAKTEVSW